MHQGAAGGTHTYPTFFTSQLLGLLQEKENRCSRDFLTSQNSETVWKKQPCVFWDLRRRSGLCQAPCRGLAGKDRPCGTFAFLSGAGGRPAVCGREDSRQSGPRARRRARLPVPAGGQRTERRPPRRVSPPAPPRGRLRLTVTHVTPSRSSVLLSWLRRLTRLCLPKGKKGYVCFEQ